MPKFGMTHRKPSPWSKRASLQGCVPRNVEDRLRSNFPELRWSDVLWRIISYSALLYVSTALIIRLARVFGVSVSLNQFSGLTEYLYIAFVIATLVAILLRRIGRCRLRRRVLGARGYLCPICTYNLQGIGDDDPQCPECGSTTPRRECVLLWCQFMRSKD